MNRTKTTDPLQRASLATKVGLAVSDAVESFEVDHIGADLAYLLIAILVDGQSFWSYDRPIVRVLRALYPSDHRIWRHIVVGEDTG